MALDLRHMVGRFDNVDNRESDTAWFLTRLSPERLRYLNVIVKPLPWSTLGPVAERLRIPESFVEFLRIQNGGVLFLRALVICGVRAPGQLMNRQDPLSFIGYDLETENPGRIPDLVRFMAIGAYLHDRTGIGLDRVDGSIGLWREGMRLKKAWPNLEAFLTEEVPRLAALFDARGTRLVESVRTLPDAS